MIPEGFKMITAAGGEIPFAVDDEVSQRATLLFADRAVPRNRLLGTRSTLRNLRDPASEAFAAPQW